MRFFLLGLIFLALAACTGPSDDGVDVYPSSYAGTWRLIPNDSASGDSAAAWLAEGAFLRVQPGGGYNIAFDSASGYTAPILHLFRVVAVTDSTWRPVWLRSVEASSENGRWTYAFDCNETEVKDWSVVLEQDGEYWKGPVKGLHFAGSGGYGSHLGLNLVVAGSFAGFSDGVSLDSAARALLLRFRSYLASAGIVVDTLVVRQASQHPAVGSLYSDSKQYKASYGSEGISTDELGGWEADGLYEYLDLVLVNRFAYDGLLGLSPLYGRSLGGGAGSTVALATHFTDGRQVYNTSSEEWISTAIHESAHFFGLRHTTSTTDDIESGGDASIVEDGLDDTPSCSSVLQGSSMGGMLGRLKAFATSGLGECPDVNYLLFPSAVEGVSQNRLSAGELSLWKKNLELFPH